MQNDMGMTTWEIYYEKTYYMGLEHAYYELWKLQEYWLSICLNATGVIRY